MVRLDSHLLPSFLAVADCLNFTEAARQLGATQSGLSQHIAKLEESLGGALFIRANKKIVLTPAGIAFRKFAENYLEHETHLFQEILGEKGALRGEVKYAMPESCLMTPHLSMLLDKRSQFFPELKLKVTIAGHEEILRMVQDHEVDFGFSSQNRPWPGLSFDQYCMEEYVLVGTKEYAKSIKSLDDLTKAPFLLHPGFSDVVEAWWKKHRPRQVSPELNIVASLNHFQGMKALLLAGTGVSIVPRQCAETELNTKKIVQLLPNLKSVQHPISIVTSNHAPQSLRVKRVIQEFHAMID